jgi:low temperature requirement protein LtrA
MMFGARNNFLRVRKGHDHSRVTFVELFFDLVFVFAITQISHFLLEHFSAIGVAETILLLLAVWWVWIYTSWATNWLDPQTTPVRIVLFALMLAGLVLSTSIPQAFDSRGLAFAGAYVAMQVGRCLFVLWVLRHHSPGNFRNFQRITSWLALAGLFWLAGGLADGNARLALWTAAMLIDLAGPAAAFWTPWLGRSQTTEWDIEGAHMAERCGLFIIIALGESILVTGVTFGKLDWNAVTIAAFFVAFIGSVAMWWIYFNIGAERGSRVITSSSDPGRLGRIGYTYAHLPIVAGIVVAAVSDELVLVNPTGHTDFRTGATTLGGAALFLIGNALFKRLLYGRYPLSHLIGLVLLVWLIPAALVLSPLIFSAAAALTLVIVAVWETRSLGASQQAA